eukprot:scaffold53932_cov34-Tisochrysis_lutea.AAC.1
MWGATYPPLARVSVAGRGSLSPRRRGPVSPSPPPGSPDRRSVSAEAPPQRTPPHPPPFVFPRTATPGPRGRPPP